MTVLAVALTLAGCARPAPPVITCPPGEEVRAGTCFPRDNDGGAAPPDAPADPASLLRKAK